MSAVTVEVEGVGSLTLTLEQAFALADRARRMAWRAMEAPAEAFREQMFGDPRRVEEWETVRLFITPASRRAHVIEQADISARLDGVRVGDPFVSSACSMVWAFADNVSLEVGGMPVCEACARTLLRSPRLRDLPVMVGGKS